jgi:hypothetical protein
MNEDDKRTNVLEKNVQRARQKLEEVRDGLRYHEAALRDHEEEIAQKKYRECVKKNGGHVYEKIRNPDFSYYRVEPEYYRECRLCDHKTWSMYDV